MTFDNFLSLNWRLQISAAFVGGVCVKFLRAPWVRIASSVLSARDPFLFNQPLAESTLEAMRTQGARKNLTHTLVGAFG